MVIWLYLFKNYFNGNFYKIYLNLSRITEVFAGTYAKKMVLHNIKTLTIMSKRH